MTSEHPFIAQNKQRTLPDGVYRDVVSNVLEAADVRGNYLTVPMAKINQTTAIYFPNQTVSDELFPPWLQAHPPAAILLYSLCRDIADNPHPDVQPPCGLIKIDETETSIWQQLLQLQDVIPQRITEAVKKEKQIRTDLVMNQDNFVTMEARAQEILIKQTKYSAASSQYTHDPKAIFSIDLVNNQGISFHARSFRLSLSIPSHDDFPVELNEALPSVKLLLEIDKQARSNPDPKSDGNFGIVVIDNTVGTLWRRLMDHLGNDAPVIPPTPAEQAAKAATEITATRQRLVDKGINPKPLALQRPAKQPKQGHAPK